MGSNFSKVVVAGVIATLVMTAVGLYLAPMMGMPAMNPAEMLGMKMGGSVAMGWAAHLMIGVVLAFIYAKLALGKLPGPPVVQGALFGLAPWLFSQVVMMPLMMGAEMFSGSMQVAMGSMIGHLVYGAVLGAIVGSPPAAAA
ncbi:MAG: DUF6789 family protein [Gemmatimonadales bacterium]|jgi:uncharacterized membrane protein YagU involved in acid resistance|nr:DUF6789 family protein [Gemmatimonadales bacterium]MDZ4389218.1 DUF6789 family protein [Gemmatimonadales bacterium]